jgi:kynurenine formamidase
MTCFDLSWPLTSETPCTFSSSDKVPIATFEEGDSRSLFFVTSRIDNLYSNAGTQVDMPAHLPSSRQRIESDVRPRKATVGEYPIERFVGDVAVLDFSAKMLPLEPWFDDDGVFVRDRFADFGVFAEQLDGLEISVSEFDRALTDLQCNLDDLNGVLIYSDTSRFWVEKIYESWEYRYFYSPYFSTDLAKFLVDSRLSFVGIDSFQIEHPASNFRGDELPVMVNSEARQLLREINDGRKGHTNHDYLLGGGLMIYESLRLSTEVTGTRGYFSGPPLNLRLAGLDDGAMTRPYLIVK